MITLYIQLYTEADEEKNIILHLAAVMIFKNNRHLTFFIINITLTVK